MKRFAAYSKRSMAVLVIMVAAAAMGRLLIADEPQSLTGTWTPGPTAADIPAGAASAILQDGRTLVAGGGTNSNDLKTDVAIFDPATGTWTPAGSMATARSGHTATTLADGHVLIVGGTTAEGTSANLELFDPGTGTSTPAGVLSVARVGHAAAALNDGRVLIAGGSDGANPLALVEIYDPSTGSVSTLEGTLALPRVGLSATTLLDGRVLVVGGSDGVQELASAELYDPQTQTFSLTSASPGVARRDHAALLLPHNNGVLIAGGRFNGAALTSVELFIPTVDGFATTGPMTVARGSSVAGPAGSDGTVFIAGGGSADAEVYHFATIKTNKSTYLSEDHVVITGTGWKPLGQVTLAVGATPGSGVPVTMAVNTFGNIGAELTLGSTNDELRFYVTAADEVSQAQTKFIETGTTIAGSETAGVELCSVTGNETIVTDKADYAPEQTVLMTGAGYSPHCPVVVQVRRPDGSIVKGDGTFNPGSDLVTTSDAGELPYAYILDGITGTYEVKVLGAGDTVLATTTFTDAANLVQLFEDSSRTIMTTAFPWTATAYAKVTTVDSPALCYRLLWKDQAVATQKTTILGTGAATFTDSFVIPPVLSSSGIWTVSLESRAVGAGCDSSGSFTAFSPAVQQTFDSARVVIVGAGSDSRFTADNPGGDNWVVQNSTALPNNANTVQGGGTGNNLQIPSTASTTAGNGRAFLRFDVAAAGVPSTATVSNAKVRLTILTTSIPASTTRTHTFQRAAAPWSEGAITWNNQPAATGVTATLSITSGTPTGKELRTGSLTTDVQGFVSGTFANDGWRIVDNAEGTSAAVVAYRSTESNEAVADVTLNKAPRPVLLFDYAAPPDLTATKTHSPNTDIVLGNTWTWKIHVATSPDRAIFSTGQTILTDNMPTTGISSYGSPSVQNAVGVTGTVNCGTIISGDLNCTASGGVTIAANGSFDVVFTVTPSAAGTFSNPRSGAGMICKVDPNGVLTETNENNNTCSDSVTVVAPDLTATKTNDVSGTVNLGSSFHWTIRLENEGTSTATFLDTQRIFIDNLPSGPTYSPVTITPSSGAVTGPIVCTIVSNQVGCGASGGSVVIPAGEYIDVKFTVTPQTAPATLTNPVVTGICRVDENGKITESNENNNDCNTNSVTVMAPDLIATKTNDVSGTVNLGSSFHWNIRVKNQGNAPATFVAGNFILRDDMPTGPTYPLTATVTKSSVAVTGTIACPVSGAAILCSASGSSVVIPANEYIDVNVLVTPQSTATLINPNPGVGEIEDEIVPYTCMADPSGTPGVVPESNEGNNSCWNTVAVTSPNLTISKSNNVSGATTLGNNWTWTLHVANSGTGSASFPQGATILSDGLPNANLSYGTPGTANAGAVTGSGAINCNISSNTLTCTASGGTVVVGAGVSFDVQFTATPTAIGTFTNPRAYSTCSVDPGNAVPESAEGDNACAANTVTVTAPNLTISKSNNVSGATTLGNNWTWTLHVANGGNASASFAQGATILSDGLPNANLNYGTPGTANAGAVTGTGSINCSISSNTLTCTASGGTVVVGVGVSFDVQFTATPTAIGTFTNPRAYSTCSVDPGSAIPESAEGDNACAANTVTVTAPDLTASKANNVSGKSNVGGSWIWTITVGNVGNSTATFNSNDIIVSDSLPDTNIGYASVGTASLTGIGGSGSISCSVDSITKVLSCKAYYGTVTIAAAGSFKVNVTATPTAAGVFTNPRASGVCKVDPLVTGNGVVYESNESNNACAANTVNVNGVTVDSASGQYSDVVTLTAHVNPTGITGSVAFTVNGSTTGLQGSPTYSSVTGIATQSYKIPLAAPGPYTIAASFTSSDAAWPNVSGTNNLTVTKEDTVITPDAGNPMSLQVTAPGGNAPAFTIKAAIAEVSDSSLGNIAKATPTVSCTLIPVGPGGSVGSGTVTTNAGSFSADPAVTVAGPLVITCPFAAGVAVNIYDVVITISTSNNYYQGSAHTALNVFDPSLGFTTGGGRLVNPNTGYVANFGFNAKYLKSGQIQGSLLYVEHRPTGDVVLKSNAMGALAVYANPNSAIFNGKATLNGAGNNSWQANVFDYAEPGANKDKFGLKVTDPSNAGVTALTFAPVLITHGNIQVPQPSSNK